MSTKTLKENSIFYTEPEDKIKYRPSAKQSDEHIYEEVNRLKRELHRVTQERDLLKKTAAYFAKESR